MGNKHLYGLGSITRQMRCTTTGGGFIRLSGKKRHSGGRRVRFRGRTRARSSRWYWLYREV